MRVKPTQYEIRPVWRGRREVFAVYDRSIRDEPCDTFATRAEADAYISRMAGLADGWPLNDTDFPG